MQKSYKNLKNVNLYLSVLFSLMLTFPIVSAEVFDDNPTYEFSFFDIPKTFDDVYCKLDSFAVNLSEDGTLEYLVKFHFISPTQFNSSEKYYEEYITYR